uniref:MULE transposase domain-containing protein n=1 Tax=Lactuca sativa TaxID=4236 RepID=A0A9R1X5C9_LACSA|nr:hypothetical protein LSAT_V11C700352910 [Lactuca sativa]
MNIVDEADVHQLRNVMSKTKEICAFVFGECPQEEIVAVNTVEEKNLYEFGRLCDKNLSNDEESNEGWLEDEFTHGKKTSYIIYSMPPIPDCPDPFVEPGPFHSLGPNVDMFVRQTYDNKQQLIFTLSLKATRGKFQFMTKHSNKNRYEVYCEIENYWLRLYAKRIDPADGFEISTFNNVHTCSSLQIHPNHKHTNKKFMGTILLEIMGKTRSKVWRPNEISRDLNALMEINVSYKQVWLPIYFHNLKKHNPGIVAYIQTDFEDCFECCFYAIGSTIRAFKRFCSKVIIIDGAHLKGGFKGTILDAIAMDWNNQIVPVVHRICKKKRVILLGHGFLKSWMNAFDIVTDRADAIRVSIENVFPNTHHGVCAFYLLGNIVHPFGKMIKTKVLFWRLVRAYKRNVFEDLWYRFSSTRPQCRVHGCLYVDARKMPIIPLLEFFCCLSQEWCNKRRIDGGKHSTVLTEWAEKVVSKNEERITGWSVSVVSDAIYHVHDFKHGGIVDMRQETCTCKYWEGTYFPCGYVIMVLKHLKKTNFGQLAIDAYKTETYQSMYEETVYPLPEPCNWEIPDEMMVAKPPIMDTHQAGRPKNKNHIPSQGEEPIVRRCNRCDSTTHNAATCPKLVPMKQKNPRKSSMTSGSKTKGKGTQGTHETLETHGMQDIHRTQGTQREDYCSMFDLND